MRHLSSFRRMYKTKQPNYYRSSNATKEKESTTKKWGRSWRKYCTRVWKVHQDFIRHIGKPPNQGIEKRKLLCRVRWRFINISRRLSIDFNYCWKHFQSIVKSLTSFLFVGLQRFWRILKSEATSRESSRSFSVLHLTKTYLRLTMKQSRLNHLMILNAYKSRLVQIDLIEIASTFVDKNEARDVNLEGSSFNFFFFLLCSD